MADSRPRIVFADASDERILSALTLLARGGAVTPIVVEPPGDVPLPASVEAVSVDDPEWADRCSKEYGAIQAARGRPSTDGDGPTAVGDPLLFAALYTRLGGADAGVAGSLTSSPTVIRAGLAGLGLAKTDGLVSGCFIMELGGQRLTYADASVTPDPDAGQLAAIAAAAADCHYRATGDEPKVAMLSFSTHGTAEHADVTKVRDAVAIARRDYPDLCLDGELQFDVAISPQVAARKCPGSPVAGQANVFVFPDLGAANIAYKVTERLAGARAIGSFVLGLRRPWVDLSRGCSVGDVVSSAMVAAEMAAADRDVMPV